MIRFLHAADLHLGLRVTRFDEDACKRIGEARFEALENLRAEAVEHRVDFIVIAGDLFDDHSVARVVAERAFSLFAGKSLSCPVYIIPGNHDPLSRGGVWDRDPWDRAQDTRNVRLLREARPEGVPGLPVTLFPCPLRNRNSIVDPTGWIAQHPRAAGDNAIRIGVAHGSLNLMTQLPEDDHLIRRDAADHYGLDYLALGHWHSEFRHKASDGADRTAYSGTHEPMRFRGAGGSVGWASYSRDGDDKRFHDDGRGAALLVTIDEAGAPPRVERLEIGHLRWADESLDVTSLSFGELFKRYAECETRAKTLLRLHLHGVLDPERHRRLDELRDIIGNRFYPGSLLDFDAVLIEPTDEELHALVGHGVLSRVLERLQTERTDPATRVVAEHALKQLYRLASEAQTS